MEGLTLVLGSTGLVGGLVAEGLLARRCRVRCATRQPARARRGLPAEAEAVEFDYDRPETFRAALDGVDRLFLSVRPGDDASDETATPFVDCAVGLGVRRIVSLTAMGVERLDDNALRRIERRVEASGVDWTHLRPNFFMQIFARPPLLGQLLASGALRIPAGEARLSFVDARDIAAAAVNSLLEEGRCMRAYTLTGGEAVDHASAVAAIARATGRPFGYVPIGEEEARALMTSGGLTPARAERLIGFYRLVRAGACAPVSADVETVLRRPPIRFEAFARDYASTWTGLRA